MWKISVIFCWQKTAGSLHHLHSHHHPSLREQLQFTIASSAPQSTATTPGTARTLFGRLGMMNKLSLLNDAVIKLLDRNHHPSPSHIHDHNVHFVVIIATTIIHTIHIHTYDATSRSSGESTIQHNLQWNHGMYLKINSHQKKQLVLRALDKSFESSH